MSNSDNEYITHDYSAVNHHVDEVYARDHEHTRKRNALATREHLKNVLIIITIFAAFFLLVVIGDKLFGVNFNEKSVEVVVKKEVIRVPDPSVSTIIEKPVIVEKPVLIPVEIPTESNTVTNFSIFINKDTEGEIEGIEEVITGANYPSSDVTYPDSQWCYTVIPRSDVSSDHIKLAIKQGRESVQWLDITENDASLHGSTVENLDAAKKYCSFIFDAQKRLPKEIPSDSTYTSTGTGFFINNNGHMVTNEHVVSGCGTIWIDDNSQRIPAELVASDPVDDIAVLKIENSKAVSFVKFSGSVSTGQDVVAMGYPLGDKLGKQLKVTKGNISAMEGIKGDQRYLQFTAPIQSGNSGGPLLDMYGLISGVNTATLRGDEFQNLNFAIKGTVIQSYLGKNHIEFYVEKYAGSELKTEEIADQAKMHTRQIKCY